SVGALAEPWRPESELASAEGPRRHSLAMRSLARGLVALAVCAVCRVLGGGTATCEALAEDYRSEGCCTEDAPAPAPAAAVTQSFGLKMWADGLAASIVALLAEFQGSPELLERLVHPLDGEERISALQYEGNKWENLTFCAIFAWCTPHGPALCDMSYTQKLQTQYVLTEAFSPGGYQTLMAVMNRHQVIGELEELVTSECHDKAEQIYAALQGGAFLPENSDIWDAAAVAGVDISNCSYFAVAGARPSDPGSDWPEYGADRFNETAHVAWHWGSTPGWEGRLRQFCDFSFSLFLEDPASFAVGQAFGFRFEGHHLSANMVVTYDADGVPRVTATPLMLGAFPMASPPITDAASGSIGGLEMSGFQLHSKWVESQLLLFHLTRHLRSFFQLLTPEQQGASLIDPSYVPQTAPFKKTLPNEFQFLASMTANLTQDHVEESLEGLPHIELETTALSMEAKWHLLKAFSSYSGLLSSEVGVLYSSRVNNALADGGGRVTLAWAGGPTDDPYSVWGCFVLVGDLIVELFQTNEWSVEFNAGDMRMKANHVHTMMRDLRNAWHLDPLETHMHEGHDRRLGGDHHHDCHSGLCGDGGQGNVQTVGAAARAWTQAFESLFALLAIIWVARV
ncbi:unnamed protein product, partial [Prorocentrum cordatum]